MQGVRWWEWFGDFNFECGVDKEFLKKGKFIEVGKNDAGYGLMSISIAD
jgi:hypothetical protein